MKLFGKKVGPEVDVFELKVRDDGIAEDPCWFCGGAVIVPKEGPVGDAAIIMIDPPRRRRRKDARRLPCDVCRAGARLAQALR